MGLEQIVPAFFLITILILILPGFLKSNSDIKQFLKNVFFWSVIVVTIVIISYFIIK